MHERRLPDAALPDDEYIIVYTASDDTRDTLDLIRAPDERRELAVRDLFAKVVVRYAFESVLVHMLFMRRYAG